MLIYTTVAVEMPAYRRQVPFVADYNLYRRQYGGGIPVFKGTHFQQGYGLGSLFGSLARGVLPILKSAGKEMLKSGAQALGDVISGDRDFGEVVRERGLAGLKNVGRNVTQQVANVLDGKVSSTPSRKRHQRTARKRKTVSAVAGRDVFNQNSTKRKRPSRRIALG